MKRLGVNLDHVATVRMLRRTSYPDILAAAHAVKAGGADQLTVHLREDRRHIQDDDVARLRRDAPLPLNLEMAATNEMVAIAVRILPDLVTLVPERRDEQTTERGLDVARAGGELRRVVQRLSTATIKVNLFIDPVREQLRAAEELGVHGIEFHTGEYSLAPDLDRRRELRTELALLVRQAKDSGLRVAAGHGLHYDNIAELVRQLPDIEEYNIGHAIVARALFVGLEAAVREMKQQLCGGSP